MSMNESNGIVTLMRGDSFSFPVMINIGSALSPKYKKLTEKDTVYFGLMEPNQAFEDAVLKKRYDINSPQTEDGYPLVVLNPQDTIKLQSGKYYYMIKLRTIDEQIETVKTIVPPTLFWLEGNTPVSKPVTREEQIVTQIDRIIFDGGELSNG